MRFLCLCKSVLSFCEFNFGEDFVHQVIGITSRCQACSKVFNVLLKHYFRRVCPQEPKSFSFNEGKWRRPMVVRPYRALRCGSLHYFILFFVFELYYRQEVGSTGD